MLQYITAKMTTETIQLLQFSTEFLQFLKTDYEQVSNALKVVYKRDDLYADDLMRFIAGIESHIEKDDICAILHILVSQDIYVEETLALLYNYVCAQYKLLSYIDKNGNSTFGVLRKLDRYENLKEQFVYIKHYETTCSEVETFI